MKALLQRLTQVRRGETAAVVASALSFFFILTALMVIRPAREALGMQRGIEAVRWLFIGTAVVTLAVNPVFALLVSRYRRIVFITATYVFFARSTKRSKASFHRHVRRNDRPDQRGDLTPMR